MVKEALPPLRSCGLCVTQMYTAYEGGREGGRKPKQTEVCVFFSLSCLEIYILLKYELQAHTQKYYFIYISEILSPSIFYMFTISCHFT